MGALELVQIINALVPLIQRALEEDRPVDPAEVQAALSHLGTSVQNLRDVIAGM